MYPRVGNRPSPYTFFVYLPCEDVFSLDPSLCLCLLVEGQLKQAWDQVRGDVLNSIISFTTRVVDGTWHLPMWKRNSETEYVR